MKYEEVPVQTFQRYALCDCGGRLEYIDGSVVAMSLPPWYLHKCQACGAEKHLQESSPALVLRAGS
jgi:hypothetical protein